MTSIDIMARRARVFELYAQGINPVDIQQAVAADHNVSERTIRKDLQDMKQWLPELVKMHDTSNERAAELLATNRLIRQRLMNLAETSKHDQSRVGALKSSLESVKNEMVFLQSLGQVEKVADKLKAEVSGFAPVIISFNRDTALVTEREEPDADDPPD